MKKRADFLKANSGKKFHTEYFVLLALPNTVLAPDEIRIGYTTTKKLGNAVVRNRIRRRLKALSQKIMPDHAKPQHDYVFIGKKECYFGNFAQISDSLQSSLKKLIL